MICLLLTLSLASACYAVERTITLYAHSEEIEDVGIVGSVFALKTSACNGPEGNITLETDGDATQYMGASAIRLSDIHPDISGLVESTWTFTYYAVANDTELTTLLCYVDLYNETDLVAYASENKLVAETDLLTDSNATYIGTFFFDATAFEEENPGYVFNSSHYLGVQWYANKTDTTDLKIDLWLDVAANSTKISGIGYETPGSVWWNDSVRTIWFVLLPILFVVGLAVRFTLYKEKKFSVEEVILIAVAFFVVTVVVPIALDSLYAA